MTQTFHSEQGSEHGPLRELPPELRRGLFVTGTDTGVGKTVLSALLCLALEADYFKPFQTGTDTDDDTAEVARLAELPASRLHAPAVRLKAPLSPLQAFRLEGRYYTGKGTAPQGAPLDIRAVHLPATERPIIVEGAGGALVPIAPGQDMADLMLHLGLPVVVAARSGLGTLNHTLLTIEALRNRGIVIAGVALLGTKNQENKRDIEVLGRVPVTIELPMLSPLTPESLRTEATRLSELLGTWLLAGASLPDESFPGAALSPEAITAMDSRHVWHPFTQAETAPPAIPIVRGRGEMLFAADGRQFVDLVSSWWVNPHGHAHPRIARAIAVQAARLEQVLFAEFTHQPAALLAEKLCAVLPQGLNRVFYTDNGSTAVEVALKMAHQYWRNQGQPERTHFAAFKGGYHGDTVGAMSVGMSSGYYAGFENLVFQVDFLDCPATWHDDPDVQAREDQALAGIADYLEEHAHNLAGVLIEPLVQGASGMNMTSPRFLARLAELTASAGSLLLLDEVMTGFGRTGTLFACQQAGVRPDIICLAKGLTGGFLPMAATVATEAVYQAFLGPGFDRALAHGHSFTANPLGCAAALASLALFQEEHTLEKIAALEAVHAERLTSLAAGSGWSGKGVLVRPRWRGVIGAVDIITGDPGYEAAIGKKLKQYFMDRGFFARPLGNVFYMMPPYCLPPETLHRAYDTLEQALGEIL